MKTSLSGLGGLDVRPVGLNAGKDESILSAHAVTCQPGGHGVHRVGALVGGSSKRK